MSHLTQKDRARRGLSASPLTVNWSGVFIRSNEKRARLREKWFCNRVLARLRLSADQSRVVHTKVKSEVYTGRAVGGAPDRPSNGTQAQQRSLPVGGMLLPTSRDDESGPTCLAAF